MVFQSYNLWPHMTIYENLAFGLKLRKVPKKTMDEDIKKILELVSMSGSEKKISKSAVRRTAAENCDRKIPAPETIPAAFG